MKIFTCPSCGNVLYFDNRSCGRCGHKLAFAPERGTLLALEGERLRPSVTGLRFLNELLLSFLASPTPKSSKMTGAFAMSTAV